MKKNLITGTFIAVALFFVIGINSAHAVQCTAATIIRAAVKQVAPSTAATQYFVRVTCPTVFTGERGYYLATELGDSGYATILTALSLNQTVLMNLEGWEFGSIVTEVQLNAPTTP